MKKVLVALAIMWENIKSYVIAIVLTVAILIALSSIIHNVLKIRELYVKDNSGNKSFVTVDENRMNVKVMGTGEQTVVILSDFAESSPVLKYKTYADKLSENYRVVIIEYFGYGYSLSTKNDRTNYEFATEINNALIAAEVNGPYIFLATGTSSMYVYTYANLYANNVQKLVIVDGIYPSSIKDKYTQKYVEDLVANSSITTVAEFSGYARILSYVKADVFHIDQMVDLGYSKEDIKLYRKMIASRYYTETMRREIKKLEENMNELQDYVYPDYLEVTQILSTGYIEEVKALNEAKKTDISLETYANNMITNSEIQNIIKIEGKKSNLSLDNPEEVVNAIMN